MPADISARLRRRAALANITLSSDLSARLAAYLELLTRWNQKINLTALSDPDEAVDRLLLEPVAAAVHLTRGSSLADLGSGGGSPAIPLALALGSPSLLMVESKSRKAAFLREAARSLGLNAAVRSERFQDVARDQQYQSAFDVVSVRALRVDLETLTAIDALLRPEGTAALFRSATQPLETEPRFSTDPPIRLLRPDSALLVLRRISQS